MYSERTVLLLRASYINNYYSANKLHADLKTEFRGRLQGNAALG